MHTHLTIKTQDEEHQEEEDRPKLGHGQTQQGLRVGHECEARTLLDHVVDGHVEIMRHGSQDGESHHSRDQTGDRVHHTHNKRVPKTYPVTVIHTKFSNLYKTVSPCTIFLKVIRIKY